MSFFKIVLISTPVFFFRSQEGSQFVKGFGGIGGMLRYKVDFQALQCDDLEEDEYDLDDY